MGYAEEAPYDAIHVGAAAPVVPQAVSLYVLCVSFSDLLAVNNMLHTYICKILGRLALLGASVGRVVFLYGVGFFVSVIIGLCVGLQNLYVLITLL